MKRGSMDEDKDEEMLCTNPDCLAKGIAVKVCHHFDCQTRNQHRPLALCAACDNTIHNKTAGCDHLRFAVLRKVTNLSRNASTVSTADSGHFSDEEQSTTQNGGISTNEIVERSESKLPQQTKKEPVEEEIIVADHVETNESSIKGLLSRNLHDDKRSSKLRRGNAVKQRGSKSASHGASQEYFTLKFHIGELPDIEVVQAQQSVTLREAVGPIFERRKLCLDHLNLFLESSKTPLPYQIDSFPLGGHIIHVKEKEGDTSAGSNRSFKSRSGSGSKEKVDKKPVTLKKRIQDDFAQDKQQKTQNRLSQIFAPITGSYKDKEKLELLYEKLQNYNLNGLPPMPDLLLIGRPKFDPSLYELEEHWTDIVQNHVEMDEKQRNHQAAIWELIQTEATYVKGIQVIMDVFLCCMVNLQNDLLLNEVETEKLFSNITEIIQANCILWEDHILPVVEEARKTKSPLSSSHLKEGFLKFNELFHPYVRYCLDQEASVQYLRDSCRENELFKIFVGWAETQKQCERLRLQDQIVKPMQRLTKYSLLLNAVLKKATDAKERDDLESMILCVNIFVNYVNTTLRKRHEKERLDSIVERIESYDVVDILNEECSKILLEYCHLDLTCAMPGCNPQQTRHLLCEGSLRFKDGMSKSTDAYCFLFTDMLLITKSSKRGDKDKVKVIKPPIRIDQIEVHELKDGGSFLVVVVNEYRVAGSAYTFQGEQIKVWVEKIKKAQALFREARLHAQYGEEEDEEFEYEDFGDDALTYASVAMLNAPSLKPSVSHENLLLRRNSSSDSDFHQFNISRAKSTECLLVRPDSSDSLNHRGTLEKRTDALPPKTHSFNRTVSDDELDGESDRSGYSQRSQLTLIVRPDGLSPNVPRRRSIPKEYGSNMLSIPDVNILPPSHSPPSSPSPVRRKIASMHRRDSSKNKSASRSESLSSSGASSPSSRMSPVDNRGMNFLDSSRYSLTTEENGKGKIGGRRLPRNDKRYHTADSIEDLQKRDRDASIHKRLSWNLGAGEGSSAQSEESPSLQDSKSTSVQSVISSSGVSSSGSLHVNHDGEFSHRVQRTHSSDNNLSVFDEGSEECATVDRSLDRKDRPSSASSLQPPSLSLDSAQEILRTRSQTLPSRKTGDHSKSKSTSDLTNSPVGGIPDGRKKMTHSQILRLKKQLLLNSDLEASEV